MVIKKVKIVYNSKKSNNSDSNKYSNNIIIYSIYNNIIYSIYIALYNALL